MATMLLSKSYDKQSSSLRSCLISSITKSKPAPLSPTEISYTLTMFSDKTAYAIS